MWSLAVTEPNRLETSISSMAGTPEGWVTALSARVPRTGVDIGNMRRDGANALAGRDLAIDSVNKPEHAKQIFGAHGFSGCHLFGTSLIIERSRKDCEDR